LRSTQNFKKSSSYFGNLPSKRPKYEEDFFKFCVLLISKPSPLKFFRLSGALAFRTFNQAAHCHLLTVQKDGAAESRENLNDLHRSKEA
jgi:hypothetical protein